MMQKDYWNEKEKYLQKISDLENRIQQQKNNQISVEIGSYYLVSFNDKIEMVRVSALTKKCVLFEFLQTEKDPQWFLTYKNYTIIEELSTEFIRDFKIEQISE